MSQLGSVSVTFDVEPAAVNILTLEDGQRFVSVSFGGASVILPGFNAECADYARDLAKELLAATEALTPIAATANDLAPDDAQAS